MTWLKNRIDNLKEQLRIVITNPDNFEVKWTITSSKIQLYSLVFLIIIVVGLLFSFITKGFFSGYSLKNDVSIDRQELIKQEQKIQKLTSQIEYQELYISNIKKVLKGEIIADSFSSEIPEMQQIILPKQEGKLSKNEKEIAKKVKEDMQTSVHKKNNKFNKRTIFSNPVDGKIISAFDIEKHPSIEIKTLKDMTIKACLAGTVLFTGYTSKDGYTIIIKHPNDYISIYKHAKISLKKSGARVQTGDPIGIVGKYGNGQIEPHLSFELWYNQNSVNPNDYISFK
jgi:murein DD-endopeptidase MepM/ murein hydrolase activator NlpD